MTPLEIDEIFYYTKYSRHHFVRKRKNLAGWSINQVIIEELVFPDHLLYTTYFAEYMHFN